MDFLILLLVDLRDGDWLRERRERFGEPLRDLDLRGDLRCERPALDDLDLPRFDRDDFLGDLERDLDLDVDLRFSFSL